MMPPLASHPSPQVHEHSCVCPGVTASDYAHKGSVQLTVEMMALVLHQLEHQIVKQQLYEQEVVADIHLHSLKLQHISSLLVQTPTEGMGGFSTSVPESCVVSPSTVSAWPEIPKSPRAPKMPSSFGMEDEDATVPPDDHTDHEFKVCPLPVASALPESDASLQVFLDLDTHGTGIISRSKVTGIMRKSGISATKWAAILDAADTDVTGNVNLQQWCSELQKQAWYSDFDPTASPKLKMDLRSAFPSEVGRSVLIETPDANVPCFMLRPQSRCRIVWDLTIMFILFYLTILMPFQTAFEGELTDFTNRVLGDIDLGITLAFMVDILLNFRTGYIFNYVEVLDPRRSALRYLKTWAFVDIVSTLPFERFFGGGEQITVLRVAKIGKLFRVLKIVALAAQTSSRMGEFLDEFSAEHRLTSIRRRWGALTTLFFSSHWLACGLKLFASDTLVVYQDVGGSAGREYLAGLYWAITTLTTVGYGDITPISDSGRLYSMFAMVAGGGFYGYIIGTISSIVATRDLNANAFDMRMDLSNAWMMHHKFPRDLRVKVRRYFKEFFTDQSAHNDKEAYSQLSTALQDEVCEYLFSSAVLSHPMFTGMSSNVVIHMHKILHKVKVQAGQKITRAGDPGVAMYIVLEGRVSLERDLGRAGTESFTIRRGEGFDEEVLFGLNEWCTYTATASTDAELQIITEDGFRDCFKNMPEVFDILRQNTMQLIHARRFKTM